MHFYLAIVLFITSVVAGIIFLFSAKNISSGKFFIGGAFHLACVILFLFTLFTAGTPEKNLIVFRLPFLFSICSGLILSGLAWNAKVKTIVKIYFALFLLTIPLFFFSPSRLINFLLTTRYTDTIGTSFPIRENYFLEQQSSFMNTVSIAPNYKIIKKQGLFHQTIQRNIVFAGPLDSILVLQFVSGERADIRGYSSHVTHVSTDTDSMDVSLKLVKETKNQIERRL